MEKDKIPVGQKPTALLTIKNISQRVIGMLTSLPYRIHVEREGVEAPETEFQRHRHGDFRPGDGPDLDIGPVAVINIAVGASNISQCDLTQYYDLSKPGKYSAYIEFYDPMGPVDESGIWVRSNAVEFELVPSGYGR